jgi:hypothetical protein
MMAIFLSFTVPWTLSHPAAVLPLRRFSPQPLAFAALVFGSMAPDFGYHIRQVGFATFAHKLPGTVLIAVPTGLMFLLIFYLVRRPVCYAFPQPHRAALLPLCAAFPRGLKRWLILLLSLLIGVWTHTFWDAWTHDGGWFVERMPVLQRPVFRVGPTVVDTAFCLQVLSSFLGLLVLAIAYFLWLRRRPAPSTVDPESDRWRHFFWAGIGTASVLIGMALAVYSAGSGHGFLLARAIVIHSAVFATDVGIPLGLIAAVIAYARRRVDHH